MTETPKPIDSGSAGTQEAGSLVTITAEEQSPLDGLPIARRVEGLAAQYSRRMGGDIAAGLLSGSFAQLSYDLGVTKIELDSTRKKLGTTQEELSDCKTKVAVLQEHVSTTRKTKHLKNIAVSGGTLLIALSIDLYRNDIDKPAYILAILGIIFVILGWYSTEERAGI